MNSSIFNLFEAKLSILTKHQNPSFSHIFNINLRKCCKQGLLKCHILCGLRMTKKMAISLFTFLCLIFWRIEWFQTQRHFKFFSLTSQRFFDHFLSHIFRNLQMKIHEKKIRQEKKETSDISTLFRPLFVRYLPKPANESSRQKN